MGGAGQPGEQLERDRSPLDVIAHQQVGKRDRPAAVVAVSPNGTQSEAVLPDAAERSEARAGVDRPDPQERLASCPDLRARRPLVLLVRGSGLQAMRPARHRKGTWQRDTERRSQRATTHHTRNPKTTENWKSQDAT